MVGDNQKMSIYERSLVKGSMDAHPLPNPTVLY